MIQDETTAPQMRARIEKIRALGGRVTPENLAIKKNCAKSFASQNGWHLTTRAFTLAVLAGRPTRGRGEISCGQVFDHGEFFRLRRRPVAIVCHTYADRGVVEAEVARHGLALRFLAESWYFPGFCNAFIVTRPE